MIPGDATKGNGLTYQPPRGLLFSTGLAYGLTTDIANNGTTAVSASEVLVNIDYETA